MKTRLIIPFSLGALAVLLVGATSNILQFTPSQTSFVTGGNDFQAKLATQSGMLIGDGAGVITGTTSMPPTMGALMYSETQSLTSVQREQARKNAGVWTHSTSAPSASIQNALINLIGGTVSTMKAPDGYFQVTLSTGSTIYVPYVNTP